MNNVEFKMLIVQNVYDFDLNNSPATQYTNQNVKNLMNVNSL